MKTPIERAPRKRNDEVVVVKLWDIYLRYPSGNLRESLYRCSLDSAPFQGEELNERVTFRFSREMWEERVKSMLYEHRIPVIIQSNPLYAQTKQHTPVR